MPEPKKPPSAPETPKRRGGFEVERGSGLRERETTPAPPPSASTFAIARESIQVSSRPTAVPDFDVNALAAGTSSLRHDAPPTFAVDLQETSVLVRTDTPPPAHLPHRLAALLFHVDGRASLGQIAHYVDLPTRDVIASFVELAALGLVTLAPPR